MKSFYRPHKMALWNNLVPDIVKVTAKKMDVAIDKMPHSRFPSAASAGAGHHPNSNTGVCTIHSFPIFIYVSTIFP